MRFKSFLVRNLTSSTELPPAEQLKKFLEKTTDEIYDKLQKPDKHIYHILMLLLIQDYM